MNLQEFIDGRTHCPICNTVLVTQFISGRKQKTRIENDRFVVIFVMKPMQVNQPDYEVGYSFNPKDNSFHIEFYTEWDHKTHVPMHLIEKFREFHTNLLRSTNGSCRFIRKCTFCNRYSRSSTHFNLELKAGKIDTLFWDGLQIAYESFGLCIPIGEEYKIMHLSNFHVPEPQSRIVWFRSFTHDYARLDVSLPLKYSEKILPIIPFMSTEETTRRVSNLLTFA
jgi:hypothetical protein